MDLSFLRSLLVRRKPHEMSVKMSFPEIAIQGDASDSMIALIDKKIAESNSAMLLHLDRNIVSMLKSTEDRYE